MIGDKRYTEALDGPGFRFRAVVGERSQCGEALQKWTVERWEVRMQT